MKYYNKKKYNDFGGQLKASLPGDIQVAGGIASEIVAPGNPAGIGLIAGGLGSAATGVNKYNQQQNQLNNQNGNIYNQQNPNFYNQSYKFGGNMNYKEDGGNLIQYDGGYTHDDQDPNNTNQGIPIGNDNVVEKGETKKDNYIFSDSIKVPGKKYTFAKMSKMIDNKYSKRDNDKLSDKQKELDLQKLQDNQESVRDTILNSAYKKAFGGDINNGIDDNDQMKYGGSIHINPENKGKFTDYKERTGKTTEEALHSSDAHVRQMANFSRNAKKWHHEMGGELNNPYKKALNAPFEAYNNFWDRKVAYLPQETHKMDDGGFTDTSNEIDPNTPFNASPYIDNYLKWNTTADQDFNSINNYNFDKSMTNYENQPINQKVPNNFNNNSLYNAGNFAGGAYDIYRGLKGPAKVNYDRVNPQQVDYTTSRDIARRDINDSFGATAKDLKGVNNPAQYLNLITQNAGQRNKELADTIGKSYEDQSNTNAQIVNQSKYFNAQTQQQESNARQQEKDQSSNILGAGIASVGNSTANTGRDQQMIISQDQAKRFIGSSDYTPIYTNGKITGYKSRINNQTYLIGG